MKSFTLSIEKYPEHMHTEFCMTGTYPMMSVRMYSTKCITKRKHLNIDNEKMMYSLIRRASVNKAMDYKKKSSFRHEVICTADVTEVLNVYKTVDAEEELLRKEKNKFMYMVLERFREEQPVNYDILIQVKYLDVPVEVVAEEYGLTKSGVNNRIYKAKRWLKEEFRKVYE